MRESRFSSSVCVRVLQNVYVVLYSQTIVKLIGTLCISSIHVSCCYDMTYLTVIPDGFQSSLLHIPCTSKCVTFKYRGGVEMNKTHEAQACRVLTLKCW